MKLELKSSKLNGRVATQVEASYLRDGRSAYYVQQNRGKKSVGINLKKPEGAELVKKLILHCDALIENFAPQVMARLGLDWDRVHSINPNRPGRLD